MAIEDGVIPVKIADMDISETDHLTPFLLWAEGLDWDYSVPVPVEVSKQLELEI